MAGGILSNPEKVEDSDNLTTPNNKWELVSFLCIMQSNAEFILEFFKKAALLRKLIKKDSCFKWQNKHESCFRDLLCSFKNDALVCYFDRSLQTFIIIDGHQARLATI